MVIELVPEIKEHIKKEFDKNETLKIIASRLIDKDENKLKKEYEMFSSMGFR